MNKLIQSFPFQCCLSTEATGEPLLYTHFNLAPLPQMLGRQMVLFDEPTILKSEDRADISCQVSYPPSNSRRYLHAWCLRHLNLVPLT